MASSCVRGGLDWLSGKISLLKEWSDMGTGSPGRWLSPRPWSCSKTTSVVALQVWFSRHGGAGWMVGLHDLRGLFQPMVL